MTKIYAEITQIGNELKIIKNELPMQFSANIPIKINKDEHYKDWLLVPYFALYNKDYLPSQIRNDGYPLGYDNDTGITVLPKEAFDKKCNLFLNIGLMNAKTEERVYLPPVKFQIDGTLSGDNLIDDIAWEVEVVRFVDNYMKQHYMNIIDNLLDKSTKLLEDSQLLHNTVTEQQGAINELIMTAESQQELANSLQSQADALQETAKTQQTQVTNLVDDISTKLDNGDFDGRTVLYGEGIPDKSLGKIGDVYINTLNNGLYPHHLFTKDGDDWTPRWTMQGIDGTDTLPVLGTMFLPDEIQTPSGYDKSDEYYIPAEHIGIDENTSLPDALQHTNNRVSVLETNGVSIGDPIPIGTIVYVEGDEKDLRTGYEKIDVFPPKQLLINNDFQCNQRGKTSYGGELQKSFDMWLLIRGYVTNEAYGSHLSPKNGINMIYNTDYENNELWQFLDEELDYEKYYTLSYTVDGVHYSFTFKPTVTGYQENVHKKFRVYTALESSRNKRGICIELFKANTINIEYIDLFEGNIAYPHVKEDYAIALMRCQSKLVVYRNAQVGNGNVYNNIGYIGVPLPVPMQNTPTIKVEGYRIVTDGLFESAVSYINVLSLNNNMLSLQVRTLGEINSSVNGYGTRLIPSSGTTNSHIEISCEPL